MPQTTYLHEGSLSESDRARYAADGFLFPIRVFPEDEARALRGELEALEAEWRDAGLPRPLNQYRRVNSHCVIPLAARMAMDPRVLDVVEGILGPDLMIWSAEFFIKEPRTRQIVSMHQDLTYWGLGATDHQVTAWIALSPANRASGCMDFVAGSHRNPILPHRDTFAEDNLLSRGQEIEVEVAEVDKVAIELQPGEMSLHHGLTIHGSGPNVSDDRRIGLAIRYVSPEARQEIAARDYVILARGADRVGSFTHVAPPARPFEPWALELYEEILAEQNAALAQGAARELSYYSARR
ncbi:MAG: phytanoyl-CoA dioxygenase family protein [Alphaproteobacteria bacterium]|nr:MAG: phytanoyl-CoA dioxygenase family protein [Alphaproteobacteria bacterium]